MPFVPVPNVVMVEMRLLADNQQCENTLYGLMSTGVTIGKMQALAEGMYDWWISNIAPITNNTVALREVFCTDLTSVNGPTWARVSSPPDAGEVGFPPLPNSVSLCVSFRTNNRGRSFRGRNFFLGLSETDVAGNTVTGTFANALQAAYVQVDTAMDSNQSTWVVVSRFANGAPRTTGIATPVTSVAVVDGIVDSQRRRLPGRGN